MLYYAIKILKVLPDKVSYAWVLRDGLWLARRQDVSVSWSSDRDIVDIWNSDLRGLGLQNESDVVVEDRD